MRIGIDYGRDHIDLDVAADRSVVAERAPSGAPLADPAAAVRQALERPHKWPALRRAVTPDDHVAVVVDEQLPKVAGLIAPILEHLVEAQVAPDAVTLLCAPSAGRQEWIEDLPDEFSEVHVEVHDPTDRRRLSYLATTRHGRRLYLNRTAVDADQLVILSGRRYDPVLGYTGAEAAIYPALTDSATRDATLIRPVSDLSGTTRSPAHAEAVEVAWLLGAPFLVQVIGGPGDGIAHVIGGSLESSAEGQRLLDARWRLAIERPADVVIAGISGDPAHHDFATLASSLANAARVVQPGGKIVLLTQAKPELANGADLLRQAGSPAEVLQHLRQDKTLAHLPAQQWAAAAEQAHVYLLSGLPEEAAEELFATPLQRADQAQRLLTDGQSYLVLPDADKTLAVIQ